ncbi:Arc family DNA-binding protein [Flagellatimonas centrodinii]|uniref:FitA-like ribbon-helix-helix domain-containing protein n=1 Tax=Flagellatimonas centrodinii TaxID=2806210 RepID=UPI001FEF2267|nr:Arc family DNA-binding protein [Flagellatimonas centrodinii]ULQ47843.1 Arc family DNA-binding protein [Flagellatimonas centrodinii]
MAQFTVRNLDDDIKRELKRRAAHHGRSMEAEVRHILRTAVSRGDVPESPLGDRIAARFKGLNFTEGLPELRGEEAEPASFGP